MEAFLVIALLTWAAVSVSGTTPELSTTTGDTVNIPCLFGEGTVHNIYWYYSDVTGDRKILFLSEGELTIAAEYANRVSFPDDYSTLILTGITVADEGTYKCVVDTLKQPTVSNIQTKLNVFSLRPDTLPVITPCTGADKPSSRSIHANQPFTLTCTLPNVYPVEDTKLIWYQDGKHFSSIHDVTQNDDGTTDISRQIKIYVTGSFTCNATYISANGTENTAVSVEAWIIPPADVPIPPRKSMTGGEIACMILCVSLLAVISVAIFRFLYHWKTKGQRSSRNDERNEVGSSGSLLPRAVRPHLMNRIVSEEEFVQLSRLIESSYYNVVGLSLGIPDAELRQIKERSQNTSNALKTVFTRWRDGQRQGTDIRALLAEELERCDLGSLSGVLLAGSLVPNRTVEYSTLPQSSTLRPRNVNRVTLEFDDILINIAKALHRNSYIDDLGKALGFGHAEIGRQLEVNAINGGTYLGTLDLLRTWRSRQTSPKEKAALRSALLKAQLQYLVDQYLPEESSKLTEGPTENRCNHEKGLPPSTMDFNDLLVVVAKRVFQNSDIDVLGVKLGFSSEDIKGYMATNRKTQNTWDGTLQMLRDWQRVQEKSTERGALKTALEQSGQIHLAEDLFPSSQ